MNSKLENPNFGYSNELQYSITTEISHEEPVDNSEGHGKTVREENPTHGGVVVKPFLQQATWSHLIYIYR